MKKGRTPGKRFRVVFFVVVLVDKTNYVDGCLKIQGSRVGLYLISVEKLLNVELIDKKCFRKIDLALSDGLYKYL